MVVPPPRSIRTWSGLPRGVQERSEDWVPRRSSPHRSSSFACDVEPVLVPNPGCDRRPGGPFLGVLGRIEMLSGLGKVRGCGCLFNAGSCAHSRCQVLRRYIIFFLLRRDRSYVSTNSKWVSILLFLNTSSLHEGVQPCTIQPRWLEEHVDLHAVPNLG